VTSLANLVKGVSKSITLPLMGEQRLMNNEWRAGAAFLVALVLALVSSEPQPARSQDQAAATAKPSKCARSAFRVVIDVGHTLDAPGAMSARGVTEFAFNVQLANSVRQALVDAGFEKTVLLATTTASPPGLFERAARANSMPADLFISIHHDSVPDRLIETWQYEGKENHFSDRFKGYSIFISNNNADRAGSLKFGHLLGQQLQTRGLHYTPHYTLAIMRNRRRELLDAEAGVYRFDQLIVLKQTRMPAVLLEAGSIVNRDEELELESQERRSLTSAAVAAAVEDFCLARSQPKTVPFAKHPPRTAVAPARVNLVWPARWTRRRD